MTDIVDELRARALQGRFNLEAADEIERLRAELSEQCRLLGMSGEREAKHLAQIAALEKERDALRAKIEAMERQAPLDADSDVFRSAFEAVEDNFTQPAPSIPDDVMRDAKRYRFLRAAKNIPISTEAARDPIVYDAAIDAAMLAAAPEAKP